MNSKQALNELQKAASHLLDLRPVKILQNAHGFTAQFIYSPNETYEKYFCATRFCSLDELCDCLIKVLKDETMANIFKMTGDLFKYLTAEMIPNGGKDVVMTIKKVIVEELENQRGKQTRPIVFFKETDKGFVLGNKTNVRQMVKLFGSETDDWIGVRLALYRTDIQAFGKTQPVIRIRDYHPKPNREPKKAAPEVEPFEKDLDKLVDGVPTEAEAVPFDLDVEDTTYSE